MRPYKRFIMFCAAAAFLIAGTAATSEAQVHGRVVVGVGGGYYRPYYYRPYYYSPFFDPWYGYQYPYPPYPYRYAYQAYEPDASVRLEVKPKQAEVYVDGYYAGIVDDFDGTFQRLHVPPGAHEIELWLDGYRTVRQQVHLTRTTRSASSIRWSNCLLARPRSRSRNRSRRRIRRTSRACSRAPDSRWAAVR